jgi:hypothetical protein
MRRGTLAVAIEIAALSVALLGCPKRVEGGSSSGPPAAVRLIADTAERETTAITELRNDLEIDTRDHDRTPHVVATGETPMMSMDGRVARLYGDAEGTKGWSVDNFLLVEVLADNGRVLDRVVVGFTDGVMSGNERIDNLGRQAFNFEAGEINLTPRLPERQPFKLRATALDYFGVGRVSDVFVVMKGESGERSGDELKGQ